MMRKLLIIGVLVLASCSSVTTVRDPEGREYVVESRNDALVSFEEGPVKVLVDNRGRPSTFDELIKLYFMQWQAEQNKQVAD